MEFLKREWLSIVAFLAMFAAVYVLALKINQVVLAHNAFVRDTDARLDSLEASATLWEMRENDKLAVGR